MIGIYKIENMVNGKCYVGQSICIEKRWNNHRCMNGGSHKVLYKAFRKYGMDNFKFEVLEECAEEELNIRELFYIDKYDSYKGGYNLTRCTDNPMNDPKIRAKLSKSLKVSCNKPEYVEKLRKSTTALWKDDNYRNKVISSIDKSKEIIAENSRKMWMDDGIRERITKSCKERASTEEFKKEKSELMKKGWELGLFSIDALHKGAENHHTKMKEDKEYRDIIIQRMKDNRPNKKTTIMYDIEMNKIATFEKIADARRWIALNTKYEKADSSTIKKASDTNRKAYGYKWEVLEDGE